MGTIYYLIPDLHKKEFKAKDYLKAMIKGEGVAYFKNKVFRQHKPVGGIKVMYQHCMMLRELGYEAYPLIMGKYVGNFFGYELELKYIKDVGYDLNKGDVVVGTEFFPYQALNFHGGKKILFMQNWINIDKRLEPKDLTKSYNDLGYDKVITCGQFCSEMVEAKMSMEAATITNGIDQEKFVPKSELRIPRRVLAMSRKNIEDLNEIVGILKSKDVEFELFIADGLSQDELIKEYQKADVFLVTGYPEGLPLPPIEAMNCGCAIVGFTGGGANEYMVDGVTALVSSDGDCIDAAKKLELLLTDIDLKERIRRAGHLKGKQYTLENTKSMIKSVFEKLEIAKD